jgi:hypothetical protein
MPFGRHFLAQVRAQRTVEGLVGVGGRTKRVRQLLDVRRRHDGPNHTAHQREKLDLAGEEHLEGLRVAAGDVVVEREDLGLDPSACLGPNRVPHLDQSAVQRADGRLVVVLDEPEISGLPAADEDGRGAE